MRFSGRNAAYYNAISRIAREEHGNDLNWLVTEKLNHLEQNEYSEKERAFLAKLILAEVFIWCAEHNQKGPRKQTVHGIITGHAAWHLQATGLPFPYPKVTGSMLTKIEECGTTERMVNPDYAGLCRTMPDEIAQTACLQGFSIGIGWIVCRSPKAALRQ